MSEVHSITLIDRLITKTRKEPSGCVVFTGSINRTGYGRIGRGRHQVSMSAHRASYELFIGPIPAGLWVLHRCDNPPCVNPVHLFLGTGKDNTQDCIAKGRFIVGDHRGERHGMVKLKDADIPVIRARRAAGEKLAVIAADFCVDQSLVSLIALRKIWRHIP